MNGKYEKTLLRFSLIFLNRVWPKFANTIAKSVLKSPDTHRHANLAIVKFHSLVDLIDYVGKWLTKGQGYALPNA